MFGGYPTVYSGGAFHTGPGLERHLRYGTPLGPGILVSPGFSRPCISLSSSSRASPAEQAQYWRDKAYYKEHGCFPDSSPTHSQRTERSERDEWADDIRRAREKSQAQRREQEQRERQEERKSDERERLAKVYREEYEKEKQKQEREAEIRRKAREAAQRDAQRKQEESDLEKAIRASMGDKA